MSLVVTGTIGIDTIYLPSGEHREEVLGGSCSYFAAAASFYGPVRMVGAAGADLPQDMRAQFASFSNIDTTGLEVREGSKTFRWGGKYLADMDHRESLFTELNILVEAPPPVPASYADSRLVFLANSHPGLQLAFLKQFEQRTFAVADTMDLWIDTARDELMELLTHVDGLVLNFDEAEQMTGKANTVAAARALLTHGPSFVIVKKGEHGAILAHKDGSIAAIPAFPSETVIDPTGAGDSFAGGLMGQLGRMTEFGRLGTASDFNSLRRAMAHATIIASFTIEDFGLGRLTTLRHDEIEKRYDEFRGMLHISR